MVKLIPVNSSNALTDALQAYGIQSVRDVRLVTIQGTLHLLVNDDTPNPPATAVPSAGSGYGVSMFVVDDGSGGPIADSVAVDFESVVPTTEITDELVGALDGSTQIDITHTLAEVSADEEEPALLVPSSLDIMLPAPSEGAVTHLKVADAGGKLAPSDGDVITGNAVNCLTGRIRLNGTGVRARNPEAGDVLANYSVTAWPQVTQFPLRCVIERLVFVARDGHTSGTISWTLYEDAGYRLPLDRGDTDLDADDDTSVTVELISVAQSVENTAAHKRYLTVNASAAARFDVFVYWRDRA